MLNPTNDYTRLECGLNAWAKPDASLLCGDCQEPMPGEPDDDQAAVVEADDA
jgi:hypothetical protein